MSDSMSMSVAPLPGVHSVAMSRPQVGIERLPTRRMSNEPRESMNCKSCRKRKVGLKPAPTITILRMIRHDFDTRAYSSPDQMQQTATSL